MVVSLSHRPAAWTRSGIDKVKVVDVAGAREVAFTVLREGGGGGGIAMPETVIAVL